MSATFGIVVARTSQTAKSRLAPMLAPAERAELALSMLADVLAACQTTSLAGVCVVTDSLEGRRLARHLGAQPARDPGAGMNAAVALGVQLAIEAGCSAALVLPGDVPFTRDADISYILDVAAGERAAAVVVPDASGLGTNALLLRPPRLIDPAFGERSAARHLRAARGSGARVIELPVARLGLDIDTPADLARLVDQSVPGTSTFRFLRTWSARQRRVAVPGILVGGH